MNLKNYDRTSHAVVDGPITAGNGPMVAGMEIVLGASDCAPHLIVNVALITIEGTVEVYHVHEDTMVEAVAHLAYFLGTLTARIRKGEAH